MYSSGLDRVLSAGNPLSDPLKIYALGSGYTFDAGHTMADITASGAQIGSAVTLASPSVSGGVTTAADPVFTGVADTEPLITQVVVTITVTGVEHPLMHDDTPDLDPDGSDITYVIDPTNGLYAVS